MAAAVVMLMMSATAAAETWVSFPALLAQVKSGPLIRAIINPVRSDVEIKFRDLDEWHAFYPPAEQANLQRLLDARHIRVLFVPRDQPVAVKSASVHHHLRYIAAAVVLVVALAAACVLVWRRRSGRASASADSG